MMKLMTTSNKGKNLIKEAEGLRLTAYVCPAGKPTIGWGHTKGVYMGQSITQQQAEDLLVEDITPAERLLNGVGILVLDHIIVANDSTYSMVQHGDIDYRVKNRI
jgi:GH24 family phage-related lysozyme (muramidase)